MKRPFYHILLSLLLTATSGSVAAHGGGRDVSNRCSLVDPLRLYGDSTLTFAPGEPGEQWRTFSHKAAAPVDLGNHTAVAYNLLVPEGPGRDFDTRLTLYASDGRSYESTAHIIPTLWQGVTFDVADCPFLTDVSAFDISVCNHTTEAWDNAGFTVSNVEAGMPLDLNFDVRGSAGRAAPIGAATVKAYPGAVNLCFGAQGGLMINTSGSRNMAYNPNLWRRNTIAVAVENLSTACGLSLTVLTDSAAFATKVMPMPATGTKGIVSFNLSDRGPVPGRITTLLLQPLGGEGVMLIDRISFENETPIDYPAGKINSCTATAKTIEIQGSVDHNYLTPGAKVEVRHCPFYKRELPFDSLELISTTAAAPEFTIGNIPNSRHDGRLSHLSSRFVAALRQSDGTLRPLGEPFYISNWRDFISNPYAFDITGSDYSVRAYGAAGNGIDNDNAAIQAAIDAAVASGGGRVVLDGNGTFLATNLELGHGVELYIAKGSQLRQSPIFDHYTQYPPEYGHDNVIPGTPWTHCMYTNRPLILAKDTDHVKITGGGTIRMEDVYSENPRWTHYARICSDRIHLVPIAICNTKHVEISDIDILRSSNYHTIFYRADSVFIGNLKMHEVACLSGDGLSFGNAVRNVRVGRAIFESNDDGIVLCSSYKDPRGGMWRVRVDSIDSSVRHIEVLSSYIDGARGGGGNAIALIPWGSTNPRQDYNEIDNIEVHDCVLRGGTSVGSWPDNPFDGKPFTNSEPDDYAPVKNLRITGNEYLSRVALNGVVPTTLLTDCGLTGSPTFKNNKFTDRTAYWTYVGNVGAEETGRLDIADGTIYQGLYLEPGKYTISWQGEGEAKPYLADANGKKLKVNGKGEFKVSKPATLLLGLQAKKAKINSIELHK